ncbi:hypothetical protein WN55_02437 [Dufourea novaeangliae]|uniref:Uncharacterized protein n=1 Tax=Dufourea novaeangliae TaxID=178035 RepID=A0A154PGR6_DUFNO|nr:hypothetical protein WN55_02437 [Dufourea novaeangliae]
MLSASGFDFDSSNLSNSFVAVAVGRIGTTKRTTCSIALVVRSYKTLASSVDRPQPSSFRISDSGGPPKKRSGPTQTVYRRGQQRMALHLRMRSHYYFVTVLACSCVVVSIFGQCTRPNEQQVWAKSRFELVLRMRLDHGLH